MAACSNAPYLRLGVMPYISASIIMMLLTAVMPSLEKLKQEGESGRAKLIQYSRYMTVGLCVVQALLLAKAFEHPQQMFSGFTGVLVANPGIGFELLTVLTITSGTILLMWIGEQITERGIGNGMSIIITVGIVDRLPRAINQAWRLFVGPESQFNALHAILLLVMAVTVTAVVVAVTRSGAEDSGSVRETHGGAQNAGRRADVHAAESQLLGSHADHFRAGDPVVSGEALFHVADAVLSESGPPVDGG